MYLRLVQMRVDPERAAEFSVGYEDKILPSLARTPGCLYAALALNSRKRDRAVSLSLWKSKADVIIAGAAAGGYYFVTGNSFGLIPMPPTATSTSAPPTPTATTEPTLEPTTTVVPPTETSTPVPASPTIAVPQIPLIGGADMLAFTRDNDIWIVNVDGSELRSVTNDRSEKFNVEWLPDGESILYITGKTVKTVNSTDLREEILTSFASAEYFDAFRISPDGTQVAISLNRELHVVPFDRAAFGSNPTKATLLAMDSCLFYNEIGVKDLFWSDDGQKLAVEFTAPSASSVADTIRVLDIHLCKSSTPIRLDEFPAARFTFPLYIVNFDWDGDQLFTLNSNIRNGGFGDLVIYNTHTESRDRRARGRQVLLPRCGFQPRRNLHYFRLPGYQPRHTGSDRSVLHPHWSSALALFLAP